MTLDENLVVHFDIDGDSNNESVGTDGFLKIELPPIMSVFVSFNLLQNLVDFILSSLSP
jgi:hypothetical protein